MSTVISGTRRAALTMVTLATTSVILAGPATAQPSNPPLTELSSLMDAGRVPAAGGLLSTGDGGLLNFGGTGGFLNFGGDGGIGNFSGFGGIMNFDGFGRVFNPGICGGFFGVGGTDGGSCGVPMCAIDISQYEQPATLPIGGGGGGGFGDNGGSGGYGGGDGGGFTGIVICPNQPPPISGDR